LALQPLSKTFLKLHDKNWPTGFLIFSVATRQIANFTLLSPQQVCG